MNNRYRILRVALSLMLTLALSVTVLLPASDDYAYAASSSGSKTSTVQNQAALDSTYVTKYKTFINKRLNQTAKITATIKPANGTRAVSFQRYDSSKKKWVTMSKVTTADADSAKVSYSVPEEYRKKTDSRWRIYVAASPEAKSAKSKTIRLVTRNITEYSLSAKSVCIYDVQDDIFIYAKDSTKKRAQASTTKLMSALVVMESGKIKGKTKITKNAAKTPWGSYRLKAGDTYRNKALMYAMLLPSANDAATALADGICGSEKKFVKKMNQKAAALGLKNTHFMNPHGLDAYGHYSTAQDMAKIMAEAYKYPFIRKVLNTYIKTIKSLNTKKKWTLYSTNAIFGYDSNFKGGKTGTTGDAGCCFAGVYTYGGKTYVTVVLGSEYGFSRWSDTKKLHSYIKKYATTKY